MYFVHLDLQTRFSPQVHAIFRHRNFKKLSAADVFCTLLLATAACNFSTSDLQKVLPDPQFFSVLTWKCTFLTSELEKVPRHRQFFNILTWKCASRHSGVQFLISPLTTWLRTRRFNEPTFRLTLHTNHWKNTAFRDFSNISRVCIFFLLTFALLHLLSSDFTSSHLLFICFLTLWKNGAKKILVQKRFWGKYGLIWISNLWYYWHLWFCNGSICITQAIVTLVILRK